MQFDEELKAITLGSGSEFSEVLITSWRLFARLLLPLAPVVVLFASASAVCCGLVPLAESSEGMGELTVASMQMKIANVIGSFFESFVLITAMVAAARLLAGKAVSGWGELRDGLSRWFPVVWTAFLLGLLAMGTCLLVAIPVSMVAALLPSIAGAIAALAAVAAAVVVLAYCAMRIVFFSCAAVFDGISGVSALGRSLQLTRSGGWRLAGVLIVAWLVNVALCLPGVFVAIVVEVLKTMLPISHVVATMVDAFTTIFSFYGSIFLTIVVTVLYLRRRNERNNDQQTDSDSAFAARS